MLGIGGRFAGAKGMVQMPDLANLNPEQAAALIASNGLRVRNQNSNNTTNSALGNKVFGQSITAGELVDYETQIDFSYYAYAAPAVTITYGSPEPYDTTPEYGCNKTPNNQGSTNQYYYCTRNTTYYRSKKYEDGVWNGEYGQYSSATDANWDCVITAGQCGNTQVSTTELSRTACNGSFFTITYRRNYAAGIPTNVTYSVQESCNTPTPTSTSATRGNCSSAGVGGCKCGQRSVTTTTNYSDGSSTTSTSYECCPDSTSCNNTATYWFACGAYAPNKKRWTYRTVCTDCVGGVVSDTRVSGDVDCCTASCGAWSSWIKVATWVESRTRTCQRDDCSTYSESQTRCIDHCDTRWYNSGSCSGGIQKQTQTCQGADCSYYYKTRFVICGTNTVV